MEERLSAGLARTLLGPRFKSQCEYFLMTKGDGMYIRIFDPCKNQSDTFALEPMEADQEKIHTSPWVDMPGARKFSWFNVVTWLILLPTIASIVWVILWRLNMLDTVLLWLRGVMG